MMSNVNKLLSQYKELEGSQAIEILIQHTGRIVSASTLHNCLYFGLSPNEASKLNCHMAPIPMTDQKTIAEIDKRLNYLLMLKAETGGSNMDWKEEIAFLKQYRKDTTKPYGGIKNFGDDDLKAYHRIHSAINRLIKKASKEGFHEAVSIIKKHLKQGVTYQWITESYNENEEAV